MKKLFIPLLGILLTGCVTTNTASTGEQAQDYLELWMQKWNSDNGKDVKPTDLGIYILDDVPGPAAEDLWSADNLYCYAEVTIRSLDGKISSSDSEDIAKQLGTYSVTTYYGPKVFMVGEGISYAGVDEALKGMRLGGERTVVVPSWLLTTSRYSSLEKYLAACTSSSHLIYTIALREQFTDVTEWEKGKIREYVKTFYPGATPTVMPGSEEGAEADGTFWFISDVSGFSEEDKRSESELDLSVNYTGSRLDGTVFDTSVKQTAVDNDIYNASGSYTPLSLAYSTTWSDIKVNNSTSFVDGFKAGLSLMWWSGQKATVIFASKHGYSSTSKSAIPAYSPLVFELELVPKE